MHDPDHQTIRRVIAGDARAFAILVDRHKSHGMTVAMRMLKHREDAEEALQDAFVRAYRALGRFEFQAKFSTWFYRILFNVCATKLEKRGALPDVTIDGDDDDERGHAPLTLAADDPTPDVAFESQEFRTIVEEEIAALPPRYASILTFFLLEDLSYDEIVQVTGMPLGTVKTHLFRARTMLKDAVLGRMGEMRNAE